jgi:aspartate carbamoyltransferase
MTYSIIHHSSRQHKIKEGMFVTRVLRSSYHPNASYYIPLSRYSLGSMSSDKKFPVLDEDPDSWSGKSLLSVTQITPAGFELVVKVSQQMKHIVKTQGGDDRLKHKLLATIFYEASTRTSCSFQAAVMRLGGKFLHVDGQGNSSAGQKKESLEDTIRCLECYVDAVVLRHPVTGSVTQVAQSTSKPILNAGDGIGEHPTQALLDSFTIWDELKTDPKVVVFLGDLKHGRTVHSLAKLLVQLRPQSDLVLRFCAPPSLEVPESILEFCNQHGVQYEKFTDLKEACAGAQVLYVTRVQKERFESEQAYESVKGSYVVNQDFMQSAPKDMIVLHPLPRVDEISTDIDSDPRAAYFRQMENGMYVRMALLALVLGKAQAE